VESATPRLPAALTQRLSHLADHAGEAAGPDKEAALLESWKAYKTGFQQGVALFNKKPKKGIAFMQEQVRHLNIH
jgi:hypothetical protein